MTLTTLRRSVLAALAAVSLLQTLPAQQAPATPPPSPTPAPSPSPGPSTPSTPGRTPGTTPFPSERQQRQQFPEFERPIIISGKVMMDDGMPPPEPILIERVCNGNARPEQYTDTKGRFSFALGQNQGMFQDASVGNMNDDLSFPGQSIGRGTMNPSMAPGGRRAITERDLVNCEIRAALPGHRSDVVPLAGRRVLDNPDIGTLILRRVANVQGLTFSMTTALAPKDAKKAFEKGLDAAKKSKWADAQAQFQKAVDLYPKYAVAWHELGRVHAMQKNDAEARKAFGEAVGADEKFVKPLIDLAQVAARENKWEEVVQTTDRVIKLNPYDFPGAFFMNSIGNLQMQRYDEAEKSAREAMKLDPRNTVPKTQHILGIILANKQDYEGAAKHMRQYLELAPNARDIDVVKKQLAEVDRLQAAKGAAPQQPQQ
ncbi:MAG: tetratricopeptide repeat protein [Bryobacteraceae bacterium]|nr:tetratricopeptide repeat protein [Bryobacteraceae bacterium]